MSSEAASRPGGRLLCLVFLLSGAAALAFETLWFRLAGQVLGNSVWATSMVLASFMGGLALGTGLVGRHGWRVRRAVRAYALLELLIALTGVGLVGLFPHLPGLLAAWFQPLLAHPLGLNALRLGVGFGLMLVPSVAMGATLPLLVMALCRRGAGFGRSLGLLYGCNTLGAVAGTLVAETVLIERLGIRGTGFVAGGANALAALLAAWLSRREVPERVPEHVDARPALSARAWRLLAAAGLSGALVMALEVVWFRLLILFTFGTSRAFALMLAVVLAGIGLGGLLAARLSEGRIHRFAGALALVSGSLLVATYAGFSGAWRDDALALSGGAGTVLRTVWLAGPVALVSGVLFPWIGRSLQEELWASERAAGFHTLANTLGAMLGAVLGGLVLLPGLGTDASVFALALGFGLLALLLAPRSPRSADAWAWTPAVLVFGAGVLLFPHGIVDRTVLHGRFRLPGEVVAVREGLTETSVILREDRFGRPYAWRLVTNGYPMSNTTVHSRQYMKFFVYLPVALHPAPRRALLICFGVGSTARALVDTAELEHIDVVDISRDVLALSDVIYEDPSDHPLHDERVRVIVEDGRFHLQTTSERYDLITGEPPPPHAAGVVNLYSREYFQLMHDALAPGGMVSYWLPVAQMEASEAGSITRAFTDVFDESSLWMGSGAEWVLLGVRDPGPAVDAARFGRQWQEAAVAPELSALGFEGPEQLGSFFLADGDTLRAFFRDDAPLDDDHPYRLRPVPRRTRRLDPGLQALLAPEGARARFRASAHIARLWPAELVPPSLPAFDMRIPMYDAMAVPRLGGDVHPLATVHRVLTGSELRTLPLWLLGSDADEQRILDEVLEARDPDAHMARKLGDRALAGRDVEQALRWYEQARASLPFDPEIAERAVYARVLLGDLDGARSLVEGRVGTVLRPDFLTFLRRDLGWQ